MEEINAMLQDEIKSELEKISHMTPGSEEMRNAVDDLTQLYKLNNETIKLDNERNEKIAENKIKERQLNEQKKERFIKTIIDGAGIVLPLAFYAVWMCMGFIFEENGSFTSETFKGLRTRFKPTK